MVRREVFDCDRCGSKDVETRPFYVVLFQPTLCDGTGERVRRVDLCFSCCASSLGNLIAQFDPGRSSSWYESVTLTSSSSRDPVWKSVLPPQE